jgi:hypothetical protein
MRLLVEIYRASDMQLFVILEAWKTIPAMSLNSTIQANWLHVNDCWTFWLLGNVILLRFTRPSEQGYLAFIEIHLSIMATRKKVP